MDISAKYYKKAVICYNEAQLEKAMYFCEKSISNSLRSAAAVNLKGLLLYLKGELSEAEALWKLNYDYNKDQVAKKYLENLERDSDLLALYKEAQGAIEHMDFNEALLLLKECTKSDFNAIGVHNALCTVYIHLGRYEEAKGCISKVVAIDKNDKASRENTNLLIEYRVIGKGHRKKFILGTSMITIALMVWIGSSVIKQEIRNLDIGKQEDIVIKQDTPSTENMEQEKVEAPVEEKTIEAFPREELKVAVDTKNYEEVDKLLAGFTSTNLAGEDKGIYVLAQRLLIEEGVVYFYNKGRELHLNAKYEVALENYSKAELYSEKSHLKADILYMSGDCYEFLSNRDNAIAYYNKYLELYSNYGYEDTVLYKLVLIYKDSDINLAKQYAVEIRNKYENSIYNNSVVDSVINVQ